MCPLESPWVAVCRRWRLPFLLALTHSQQRGVGVDVVWGGVGWVGISAHKHAVLSPVCVGPSVWVAVLRAGVPCCAPRVVTT